MNNGILRFTTQQDTIRLIAPIKNMGTMAVSATQVEVQSSIPCSLF